ncbi:extracellular solute-binding protein [Dongia sedimenti]|uniref:Extracellular solute-binding protein n=1 Tax=Dongia sedimenti TaxID=3064282 RepID=A0ABU0YVN0_9PROT|nr:extracellular solute-binding protein [Rhodospirillaceae bacterium R-7]
MISRRTMLTNAIAATAALPFARPASAADGTTLRISLVPSIFPAMFESLIRDFEAANPGVEMAITGSYRDQSDQFQATLREGMVNDLPDLSFQGYAYLPPLKQRGFTLRLDDLLSNDPQTAELGLSGAVTSTCIVDGELHGLGVGMSFPVIYINSELAKKAGADIDHLPQDWDGILALAKKINDGDSGKGAFFQIASGGNWTWIALLQALGGQMMNADGSIAFNGPAGMQSLEIIRQFGLSGQARNDVSQDMARGEFQSGNIGVLFDSSSSLASFEKAAAGHFRVLTLPIPRATAKAAIPAAGIATVLHTTDPARQKLAWRFMTLASGKVGQTLVGKLTGYTPTNAVAIQTPDLLGDYYKARPAYGAGIASAQHAGTWFAFPGDNSIKASNEIREHLHALVTLKSDPKATMAAIESSVRTLVPNAK